MADSSNEVKVLGVDVDAKTRCAHWRSPLDIIAIKFKCCGEWFACHDCHLEVADHEAVVWPRAEFDTKAVVCGACKSNLTINDYLCGHSRCPQCGAKFNPGCAKHYDLYFAIE